MYSLNILSTSCVLCEGNSGLYENTSKKKDILYADVVMKDIMSIVQPIFHKAYSILSSLRYQPRKNWIYSMGFGSVLSGMVDSIDTPIWTVLFDLEFESLFNENEEFLIQSWFILD